MTNAGMTAPGAQPGIMAAGQPQHTMGMTSTPPRFGTCGAFPPPLGTSQTPSPQAFQTPSPQRGLGAYSPGPVGQHSLTPPGCGLMHPQQHAPFQAPSMPPPMTHTGTACLTPPWVPVPAQAGATAKAKPERTLKERKTY